MDLFGSAGNGRNKLIPLPGCQHGSSQGGAKGTVVIPVADDPIGKLFLPAERGG